MKGVIAVALKEMVVDRFGEDKWRETLKSAGVDQEPMLLPVSDVDDGLVLKIVDELCKALNLSLDQAADAFGEHWVGVYSQKLYKTVFRSCTNAKELLLKMDDVHVRSTKDIPGARPPRFDYEWVDDKTLIMTYKSHRGLIDFMVGLIRGVGKFYGEDISATKLSDQKARIVFA